MMWGAQCNLSKLVRMKGENEDLQSQEETMKLEKQQEKSTLLQEREKSKVHYVAQVEELEQGQDTHPHLDSRS